MLSVVLMLYLRIKICTMQAKVINEAGQVVPIGETGEICIRGYTVMRGYWDDDEQSKNAIGEDGWYRTG